MGSRYPRIYSQQSSHTDIETATGPGSRWTRFCWKYICPARRPPCHFRAQSPGALGSSPQPRGLRARLLCLPTPALSLGRCSHSAARVARASSSPAAPVWAQVSQTVAHGGHGVAAGGAVARLWNCPRSLASPCSTPPPRKGRGAVRGGECKLKLRL